VLDGYRPGRHPNSLANLRPAQKGEIRNPEGRNGASADREAWSIAAALAEAIQTERDPERREELMRELGDRWYRGAIAGDPKILRHIIELIWPIP
jgi:hypothetical protein